MIDGDAFVAAVTTNGTEIDKVVHLGRKPTVLQKHRPRVVLRRRVLHRGLHQPGPHRDRPRRRLGRHEDHHAPRPRLAVRAPPRPQDPPRLHLRTEAPQRETHGSSHPTRARPGGTDPPDLTLLDGDGTDEPPPPPPPPPRATSSTPADPVASVTGRPIPDTAIPVLSCFPVVGDTKARRERDGRGVTSRREVRDGAVPADPWQGEAGLGDCALTVTAPGGAHVCGGDEGEPA